MPIITETTTTYVDLTDAEKLALKGEPGNDSTEPGPPGDSAYTTWLNLGHVGTAQDFIDWLKGRDGLDSTAPGPAGKSAYQSWLDLGYVGTEADFINFLKGPPGVSAIAGVVQLDSFAGANDDIKMSNAIAYVKAQPRFPAIQLPARDINLTQTIELFTGFAIIAPFGSDGGQKNIELGIKNSTHRILLAPNMLLFNGDGDIYDVHIENLVVQGNFTQQFLAHDTGTLYASVIRGITAYGLKSTLGSHAVAVRFTQVVCDGLWQIVGPRTCQVHILGSDCQNLWGDGQLNIGGDAAAVPTAEYLVWLDGMGKSKLSNVYITGGAGNGLRLRGSSEGGITVHGAVIEGYHASQPADQLVRIDGGMVNLQNCELGFANAAILVNAGLVRVRDTNYYQDAAHQNVPLVNRVGGTVLQSGTATSWGILTA